MHYRQACTFYMNMTPWLGLQKLYGRFYTFHECLTVTYIVRFKKLTPLFDFSFLPGTKQARDYCFYVPSDKLIEPYTIDKKLLKLERKPIKVTVLGVCFSFSFM